jgi:hypothetical protein
VRGWAFNIGDLVLHLVQSNKDHHKLSPPWEGTFIIAEVLRPGTYKMPMVKFSPTLGTSNNYVTFTLSKLCVYSRWLTSSGAKSLFSIRSLVTPDPSHSRGWGLT